MESAKGNKEMQRDIYQGNRKEIFSILSENDTAKDWFS